MAIMAASYWGGAFVIYGLSTCLLYLACTTEIQTKRYKKQSL